MGDESAKVDVLSLEDFHKTLSTRLDEATSVLTALTTRLANKPPALGDFQDATQTAGKHSTLHTDHITAARRLVNAITATQHSTETIIHNYRTTEARNEANAQDIANAMTGVSNALKGGRTDAR